MSQSASIKKVRAWHEELLEFILANPRASGAEIALYFNVTEAWVSTVKNSDAFQELWAKRRGEHFSRVSSSISDKVVALAEVTVDALTDEIEKKKRKNELEIQTLTEVSNMALKALGFGMKRESVNSPGVNVNVNTGPTYVVDKDTLARARDAKTKMLEHVANAAIATSSEARPDPKLIELEGKKENAA